MTFAAYLPDEVFYPLWLCMMLVGSGLVAVTLAWPERKRNRTDPEPPCRCCPSKSFAERKAREAAEHMKGHL